MPLALRAPSRSSSLALCGSLRLILPLEGLPGDIANDFPAALDFLDWHSLLPPIPNTLYFSEVYAGYLWIELRRDSSVSPPIFSHQNFPPNFIALMSPFKPAPVLDLRNSSGLPT